MSPNFQKLENLSKSRPGKDFGKSFYLSANKQQAIEIAGSKLAFPGGEPVVTEFEFDGTIISSGKLKIKTFDAYTEEWARFVYVFPRAGREAQGKRTPTKENY